MDQVHENDESQTIKKMLMEILALQELILHRLENVEAALEKNDS